MAVAATKAATEGKNSQGFGPAYSGRRVVAGSTAAIDLAGAFGGPPCIHSLYALILSVIVGRRERLAAVSTGSFDRTASKRLRR
jgi:hypothetical protein